jgi:hypothetical protein
MNDQRWFGPNSAQVGGGFDGPSLCHFNLRAAGSVTGHVSFWAGPFWAGKFRRLGQNGLSLFHLSFRFLFSEKAE